MRDNLGEVQRPADPSATSDELEPFVSSERQLGLVAEIEDGVADQGAKLARVELVPNRCDIAGHSATPIGGRGEPAEDVRPKLVTRDARQLFDCEHTLRGHPPPAAPVPYYALAHTQGVRKVGDAAGGVDCSRQGIHGQKITYRDLGVNTYRVRRASHSVKNGRMAFSDNLRAARIAKGMTQEQLALACGWSGQSRIANYESSSPSGREPKLAEISLLAHALGVSVASLFGEADPLSQPARPDFQKIAAAVTVLTHYLELVGDPPDWVQDPLLLETAYLVAEEFGRPVQPDNVLDLTKVLAKRIRGQKEDVGQHAIQGTGAAARRKNG